jgi:hypothetical protein
MHSFGSGTWHNVDNILRPGSYFTPSWIVNPAFAFAMDKGFLLWLTVLGFGVVSCIQLIAFLDSSAQFGHVAWDYALYGTGSFQVFPLGSYVDSF